MQNNSIENWFIYPIKVQPHHTDYAGIVWHGNYLQWMESARVEYLESKGIKFSDLVDLGCDLPVVDINIRYHRSLKMGMSALMKTRLIENSGIRIKWDYRLESLDNKDLYITANVTLVPVNINTGKIMRKFPPILVEIMQKLQ
ncbi:MAG TPA: thioesterase family protein [Allocoleopsis sp.]